MKKIIIIFLTLLPMLVFSGCGNNTSNIPSSGDNNNTQSNKVDEQKQNEPSDIKPEEQNTKKTEPTETLLYEFSTPIKTSSSNRLTNIQLTCQFLNGTEVENEEEFSFCGTVGQASSSKGYKKADVIVNKQIVQAIGGGMCQVSTTLYNAVLGVPGLEVTERHSHDKPVNYVESGKDATISYGTLDFKFVNKTGNKIKIIASNDENTVTIKINSIS